MQQTVSVIQSDAGEWFVFLTIPLHNASNESITALVHRTTNGIIAHSEGRKLFRALTLNNQLRTTSFATVDDTQRAAFSQPDRIVPVPDEAFRALHLEVAR